MIAISDNIQVRNDAPSGTIVINRPNRRNALSREIVAMLKQAFQDLLLESGVKAVILTGSGSTFCSGSDLYQLQETAEGNEPMKVWNQDVEDLLELVQIMLNYPKPILAAVNGPAVGIGCALMLACDLVVAADSASILMPEARRGLSSSFTAPLLAFRSSTGIASSILLSGRNVSASEGISLGIFHELVGFDLVWARANELAKECASGARESHQMTKQILNETVGEDLITHLTIGAANMAAARTTNAAKEGIDAFLKKRTPNWESIFKEMD